MLDRLLKAFGLALARKQVGTLSPVDNRGWVRILESFTGAWQRNIDVNRDSVVTHNTVFACLTLIAQDIAKLWVDLVEVDADGISTPTTNPAYSPVLEAPNHYQNLSQFLYSWIVAKLLYGNTYILKRRDARNVVNELHVLDSQRVTPLVAPDGDVFYRLSIDALSGVTEREDPVVPARDVTHDRMNTLFHPLVGLSPITACGLAATQALNIQHHSTNFFGNRAMLGGILVAPGSISRETADRLEKHWQENYGGVQNAGKVPVLGDGLKFESLPVMNATDAQLIESLKLSAEMIPPVFHIPLWKVGIGPMPSYNNIQAVGVQYLTDCLHYHIEGVERGLREALELKRPYAIEVDEDALLRMDTVTAVDAATKGIVGGLYAPNEGRAKNNLKPVKGGESPMLQQQQYSLAALAQRDAQQPPPPTDPLKPALPSGEPAMKEADGTDLFFKELTDLDVLAA